MNFPDYNSFLQLQKHFTRRSNLRPAVMVGAGMSLNSIPSPGARTQFPTWEMLSRAMFDEVYPILPNATEEQKEERRRQFNRSNALRIASEYEAAFDRSQLDSFLLRSIPDDDHQPGNIHKLLLTLPWKDVFTTNYDTLLERTYVPEIPYQTVDSIDDLTVAESPRIIKLHGSFPSNKPFIITEEDYRTYPRRFAPFVHTVRQSLIENAFVLIGFSGDDPNFLEWIGWIRDELSNRHSPIYLVGTLSLTNVDRALLTNRGVTPIDLSPVFLEFAQNDDVYSGALKWFLQNLQSMAPPRPERWPEFKSGDQVSVRRSEPSLIDQEVEPETVGSVVGHQTSFDETTAFKIYLRWRYERMQYPGWLIPSNEIRSSLWRKTEPYVHNLLTVAQNWPHEDQVLLFREILWRVEASLLPLDASFLAPFETVVDELLPLLTNGTLLRPSDKMTKLLDEPAPEVRESWLEIAFALIRDARESYDAERWALLKDKVAQLLQQHPQHIDRFYYEQALWFLWDLNRDQAKSLLESWTPSHNLPLAMMWKAGLLVELDEIGEARTLLRMALQEIRQSFYRTQGANIDLLSLEGWCTYLLMPVETNISLYNPIQESQNTENETNPVEIHEQFRNRWDELKAWDSDPWQYMEYFNSILSGEIPAADKEEQIVPGYDIGHYRIRRTLSLGPSTKWLPAFSYLRLHERVGIPLQFSGDTLRNAAEWLVPFSNFWSPMLLIRAGKTKAVQEGDFTNRTQIASMDPALARRLNTWAMNALNREISSLENPLPMQSTQVSLLETLIEFLSRLTIKLGTHELQDAFRVALRLHNLPGIKTHIRLNEHCIVWFRRMFDVVDGQQLLAWLPDVIRFPLSEEASANEHSRNPAISWRDPMTEFPFHHVRDIQEVDSSIRSEIHEATEWLLRNGQTAFGETRQRAMMRLSIVFHTNLMTEEQIKHFGNLLWEHTTEYGLPNLPDLTLFNLLHLPSPPEIDVKSMLKKHLLTLKPKRSVSLDGSSISISLPVEREDEMIREVSSASKPIFRLPSEPRGQIEWDSAEVARMWQDVYEWWENDKHVIIRSNDEPNFAIGFDGYVRLSLKRTNRFLARVVLPKLDSTKEDEWTTVLAFLSETRRNKVFLTPSLPYVLIHRPSEYAMVFEAIRDDLSSDSEDAVESAAEAISHWAYLGDKTSAKHVPPDAVNDLIKRVVFRRPEGIKTCLKHLTIIINKKRDLLSLDQIHLVVSSLTPWQQATHIPIPESESSGFPEHDRPLLRALLGQLASALNAWLEDKFPNHPEPTEIVSLRELYNSDPLPEVRRSFNDI